jgi:hypothetical protein
LSAASFKIDATIVIIYKLVETPSNPTSKQPVLSNKCKYFSQGNNGLPLAGFEV